MSLLTKKRGKQIKRVEKEYTIDETVVLQILALLEDGKTLRDCAEIVGMPENTIYSWKSRNYNNIAERIMLSELRGDIKRSQTKMRQLMEEEYKEDGKINTRLLQIQQKEAEFIRSNVIEAQKYYSNRPQVNVQVNLPQPIIDLGNISADDKAL